MSTPDRQRCAEIAAYFAQLLGGIPEREWAARVEARAAGITPAQVNKLYPLTYLELESRLLALTRIAPDDLISFFNALEYTQAASGILSPVATAQAWAESRMGYLNEDGTPVGEGDGIRLLEYDGSANADRVWHADFGDYEFIFDSILDTVRLIWALTHLHKLTDAKVNLLRTKLELLLGEFDPAA